MQTDVKNSTIHNLHHDLPPGWRWVRLGEVCVIDSNQVLPNTTHAKQLPYIGLEHIESGTGRIIDTINDSDGKFIQSTTFQFDSRHVLYGKLRPYLNKVVVPDFEGRCTTELLPLLPSDSCDRIYLAWLLRRRETVEEAMRHKTGTRMPRADMNELFKMLVPLPLLKEQKRIAAKLQELMQEVERARTACEKQLEAAKALPSAYLHQVFESEEAKQWERKRLGEVCEKVIGGGTPSRGQPKYWGGSIYWLSPSELEEGKLNYVKQTKEKITEEGSKNSNAKLIPPNSVLLSCTASVGKVAINEVPLTTNQQFNSFVLKDTMAIPEFVAYYLIYRKDDIKQLGGKTTFTFISKDEIADLLVHLPPLLAQQCIAAELKEKMAQAEKLLSAIRNQQSALTALPQAILRKAFRGEL